MEPVSAGLMVYREIRNLTHRVAAGKTTDYSDYTDFQMLVFCIKSNFGEVGFSR
jgi:hypothetical protein